MPFPILAYIRLVLDTRCQLSPVLSFANLVLSRYVPVICLTATYFIPNSSLYTGPIEL
jgi:hypothetical protein